ncbi:hypothetical protein JGS22_022680 [Streptomyces sp. P38-E01]|uniref:Uncharacterized protein n=1 Tax=Streptomyces tardus TaxID=2780544 RepID=A0A949JKG0_9ACTN|nr:hypothetical protein [Streptomyces tardus]MBU7600360.1 hypothetical protein [Streptomyces tardus]
MTDSSFAVALRDAVTRRGLPLDRLCSRLAERGIRLSPSTLSYWQRGRSQPERAESLRAVSELESILKLPPESLRALIEPHRPRGKTVGRAENVAAIRQIYGTDSLHERALGEDFPNFNSGLRGLSTRDFVWLGRNRAIHRIQASQVFQVLEDGVDRVVALHSLDDPNAGPIDVVVHSGRLGQVRHEPQSSFVVVEILLDRPMRSGTTVYVEYELRFTDPQLPSTTLQRAVRHGLRDLMLVARFHPDAIPTNCHRFHQPRVNSAREQVRRIAIDASHTAHLLPSVRALGFHGISWSWPGSED